MKALTRFCLKMVQNYLPDAFILAILLTFVVFFGGMFLMDKSALQMIGAKVILRCLYSGCRWYWSCLQAMFWL